MPKRMKVERSPNYSYYSDILWCSLPLVGMSCYFYGLRPVLLFLAALLTAYLCDCALAPLHGTGYQSHEPSSECFAALIVLMMPASISYPIVIAAVIVAVLVKEAFGGEGHYPFHPAAVGVVVAGISWPKNVFSYPVPGTQLPLFGEVNTTLVEGMNATLRDGGLPSASTMMPPAVFAKALTVSHTSRESVVALSLTSTLRSSEPMCLKDSSRPVSSFSFICTSFRSVLRRMPRINFLRLSVISRNYLSSFCYLSY